MIIAVRAVTGLLCGVALAAGFAAEGRWWLAAFSILVNFSSLPSKRIARVLSARLNGPMLVADTALLVAAVVVGPFAWWHVIAASLALCTWNMGLALQNWPYMTAPVRKRYIVLLVLTSTVGWAAGVSATVLRGRITMSFAVGLLLMTGAGTALIWIASRVGKSK
jgi:hypothetical protein